MNQSKFSLADLLTVLSALIFGFCCFLSLNFLTLGDTVISLIWAIIIFLILGGFSLGATILKRTSRNFKAAIIGEWLLIFLFIIAAFFSIAPFAHHFNVWTEKSKIQDDITASITQAEKLFEEYENYANNRLTIYESLLNSIVDAKSVNFIEYKNFGFVEGIDDATQVENKIFSLKVQLYPSHYKSIKQTTSDWIQEAKSKTTNWSPMGIVNIVNRVEEVIINRTEELQSFSSYRAKGEEVDDFDISLSITDVSKELTQNTKPGPLALSLGILLYALMLFSYFITKRHPRYPGLKMTFGTSKVNEKEL